MNEETEKITDENDEATESVNTAELPQEEKNRKLRIACKKGNLKKAEVWIEAGADVNSTSKNGLSPIILASESGKSKLVELLLEKGADPTYHTEKENLWYNALHAASFFGHTKIIKLLLEKGVPVNEGRLGVNPLMQAVSGFQTKAAELLIRSGADIHQKTDDGTTLLMVAVQSGNNDIVEMLIEAGAPLDEQNKDGKTALMFAARKKNFEALKMLVDAGADQDLKDSDGLKALEKQNTGWISGRVKFAGKLARKLAKGKREEYEPDDDDEDERTALQTATQNNLAQSLIWLGVFIALVVFFLIFNLRAK